MKPWQVEFLLVPRTPAAPPRALGAASVGGPWAAWSSARPLPRDFRDRLGSLGLTSPANLSGPEQTWGSDEGNHVEVRIIGQDRATVRVAVDTRQLDPRFAAALLALVRALNAMLVRADGLVIDGTVGAFSAALRSAPAWRFVSDPTGLLTGRPALEVEGEDSGDG